MNPLCVAAPASKKTIAFTRRATAKKTSGIFVADSRLKNLQSSRMFTQFLFPIIIGKYIRSIEKYPTLSSFKAEDMEILQPFNRSVPIWRQQASEREDEMVVWDYHVIAIAQKAHDSTFYIFDLDS